MKNTLFLILLTFSFVLNAQHSGTFEWKHHVSFNEGVDVAPLGNKIYCALKNALVEYDTENGSFEKYTSVNYLSDLSISCVKSDNSKYVVIGYANGNIDLLKDNTFYNLPEILNSNQTGVKEIKDVFFKDNLAYVASGIGVVLYDLEKLEVVESFNPTVSVEVNDVTLFEDSIIVATKNGLYKINSSYPFLADVAAWRQIDNMGSLNNGDFSEVETAQNGVYAIYNSALYARDSCIMLEDVNIPITASFLESPSLAFYNDKLVMSSSSIVHEIVNQTAEVKYYSNTNGKPLNLTSGVYYNGFYWISDEVLGLVRAKNSFENKEININAPYSSDVYSLTIRGDRMVVAGGGFFKYSENTYNSSGFYTYKDGVWNNTNVTNSALDFTKSFDYKGAIISPENEDHYFVYGHSGQPVIEMNGNEITNIYNTQNSTLDSVLVGGADDIRIGGGSYDKNEFVWLANSFSQTPLKIISPDGLWYETSLGSGINGTILNNISIDYNDLKWISSLSGGIAVYDHNRTETDFSDDQVKILTSSSANLPSNTVYCTTMDLDQEIWIGTSEGLAVIYNGSEIFTENATVEASRILIQKENDVEILLGTNSIIDIEIDGANRKWIAVEQSGLICLSPDGSEEIYNFNQENSPLVSNNIFDIEIDHKTGEVFVATDKGLMSFRADASQGDDEFSDVKVFPNPVRPEYTGVVTVSGLGYDSDVNITDVSGNVVYQTTSNGGTVTWDCNTLNGERVTSGVYLFWSAQNVAKGGRKVAKVMIIN
jgi:ligand-binding sensor domain-containing protein